MEYHIHQSNRGSYFIEDERGTQLCEEIKTLEIAHKIMAAPDMYEALKALKEALETCGSVDWAKSDRNAVNIAYNLTVEALAKANGES